MCSYNQNVLRLVVFTSKEQRGEAEGDVRAAQPRRGRQRARAAPARARAAAPLLCTRTQAFSCSTKP